MRLDQQLVALGLAPSRARAQTMIEAGQIRVDGRVISKAGRKIGSDASVEVTGQTDPWVSRAALKLLHALGHFGLTPSGAALDVGASTGGFTQVLLSRGAEEVFAIDVGHRQMHPEIAEDPRVRRHDGVNAREIEALQIPQVAWITIDVSFISLTKVLPSVLPLAMPGAVLIALIKPQFEVGPGGTVKGIVRDSEKRDAARSAVRECIETQGWVVTGEIESPITGADGNREFLIAARNRG
ncbi:MAG: TlyA family RNA methyltransferase [Pseudomonadota bacterium]